VPDRFVMYSPVRLRGNTQRTMKRILIKFSNFEVN